MIDFNDIKRTIKPSEVVKIDIEGDLSDFEEENETPDFEFILFDKDAKENK